MKSKTLIIGVGAVAAAAAIAWHMTNKKKKAPALIVSNITPDMVSAEVIKSSANPNALPQAIIDRFKYTGKEVEPSTTLAPTAPTLTPVPATPTPLPAPKLTIQPDISIRNSDALVTKSVTTSTKTLRGFGNAFILN